MSRGVMVLVVAVALVGFAPAPWPRKQSGPRELSLAACQGLWDVVRKDSITTTGPREYHWSVTQIRIQGDRWTLLSSDGSEVAKYSLDIGTARIAPIDWFTLDRKDTKPLWGGLVQRDGDKLLILYSDGDRRGEQRQSGVHDGPPGSYIITVRKAR